MGLLSNLFNSLKSNSPPPKKNCAAQRNNITCAGYYVKGKNPDTGRVKRVYVLVESAASIEEVQKKSGLLPPYEIEKSEASGYNGPTERQLAYAKDVGVELPMDATAHDATIFLTRYEEKRPLYPPPTPDRIVRLLIDRGIDLPAYAGVYEASDRYLHHIDLEERIAFFAMRVYCKLYGKKYCLLEDATQAERERFFDCARTYQGDKAFVRSVFCYTGADLPLDCCPAPKKLKAYDMVADYFKK